MNLEITLQLHVTIFYVLSNIYKIIELLYNFKF